MKNAPSKKIAIFAGNNLPGHLAVNRLVPHVLARGVEPAVFIVEIPRSKKTDLPQLEEYSFYETGILRDTVCPFLDSCPVLRGENGRPLPGINYSPAQIESIYGIKTHYVSNVNDPAFIQTIEADKSIFGGISIRNLQIFGQDIIDVFRAKGFLWNLHVGELPGYRGVFIPPRAIINGEERYGWTLHHVDHGIDTGRIISIRTEKIRRQRTMLQTYVDFVPRGVSMIANALAAFLHGEPVEGCPQPPGQGNYYSFPTAAELAIWERLGISLASPEAAITLYVSRFSVAGTPHALALKERLLQTVTERRTGQQLAHTPEPLAIAV